MKRPFFIPVTFAGAILLLMAGCSHSGGDKRLMGEWQSKADSSTLKITEKQFMLDSPEPEDYFVKGDTIFTSFEGNLPYTKYAIKKLTDKKLILFTPDSTIVEFEHQ